MKKLNLLEKAFVKKLNDDFYHPVLLEWESMGYSVSKIKRSLEILVDIVKTNGKENALNLYKEYRSTNQKRKLLIRYGDTRLKEYEHKLKKRPRPKINSHFTEKYWIEKGYTKKEAKSAVTKVQSKNALKRDKNSYKTHSKKVKWSIDYWTNLGYTKEEAKILREPYLKSVKNDLDSLIYRHGEEEGIKIYEERIKKYKNSIKKSMSQRKTGGYVSKESLKFFIPLYKFCRKIGILRKDIYLGVNGSKEFFLRENKRKNSGVFVDFCIPSLNIVIEYNGLFWHPRNLEEWKNPFIDYDTVVKRDNLVKELCKNRGFELFIIWSDCDFEYELQKMKEIIHERYTER